MSNSRDTIYSYYKTTFPELRQSSGYTCIRIQRPPKEYNGSSFEYKFSYSFCSPEDNFSKRVARSIADGRAERKVELTFVSDKRKSARELSEIAIEKATDAAQQVKLIGEPIIVGNGIKIPRWLQNVNKEKTQPAGVPKQRK